MAKTQKSKNLLIKSAYISMQQQLVPLFNNLQTLKIYNFTMENLLIAINEHIKKLNLTHKLLVLSDGKTFILMYQNTFQLGHEFEKTSALPFFKDSTTLQHLTAWVDNVIQKPR
jgi:hypothetical protein